MEKEEEEGQRTRDGISTFYGDSKKVKKRERGRGNKQIRNTRAIDLKGGDRRKEKNGHVFIVAQRLCATPVLPAPSTWQL